MKSIEYLLLMKEVEDFLYKETALLDERKFSDWLNVLTDDVRYWMPMRRNMSYRDQAKDITREDEIGWFDDDKLILQKRVQQIESGVHWAEEPLSRISRLVSNIHLPDPVESAGEGDELLVKSNILVHRSRNESERDMLAARRWDILCRTGDTFKIKKRTIIIDEAVMTTKSLTFFL